ncbi:MAG TPA: hypothetical protein VF541_07000 [Longimicrobium sp.]|jgi:Spy/CpxP family protein refolding chaperone
MRKILASFALLLVCAAAPAAAQRSGPSAPSEKASALAVDQGTSNAAAALFPTTDEVRAQVRAREEARGSRQSAQMDSREMIALVAAIVVGIVIAAVILD